MPACIWGKGIKKQRRSQYLILTWPLFEFLLTNYFAGAALAAESAGAAFVESLAVESLAAC